MRTANGATEMMRTLLLATGAMVISVAAAPAVAADATASDAVSMASPG